jgi:hypothetical protein
MHFAQVRETPSVWFRQCMFCETEVYRDDVCQSYQKRNSISRIINVQRPKCLTCDDPVEQSSGGLCSFCRYERWEKPRRDRLNSPHAASHSV